MMWHFYNTEKKALNTKNEETGENIEWVSWENQISFDFIIRTN